jgi:hypothetical protein
VSRARSPDRLSDPATRAEADVVVVADPDVLAYGLERSGAKLAEPLRPLGLSTCPGEAPP